jgi:hypothetical protein
VEALLPRARSKVRDSFAIDRLGGPLSASDRGSGTPRRSLGASLVREALGQRPCHADDLSQASTASSCDWSLAKSDQPGNGDDARSNHESAPPPSETAVQHRDGPGGCAREGGRPCRLFVGRGELGSRVSYPCVGHETCSTSAVAASDCRPYSLLDHADPCEVRVVPKESRVLLKLSVTSRNAVVDVVAQGSSQALSGRALGR